MSKIQWTDVTDNPIVVKGGGWYCTKVSEGCQNCYAERLNQSSFYGGNQLKYRHMKDQPELELRRDLLASWATQRKPKKHFVASMTDIFGEFVPDEWIFEILDAMRAAPTQTFQVLTKRVERAKIVIRQWLEAKGLVKLPPNIWPGVSVENQQRANERTPHLLAIPAKVRFLSCEPLIGEVDLTAIHYQGDTEYYLNVLECRYTENPHGGYGTWFGFGLSSLGGVSWVIIGGESGPNARPMSLDWARKIDFQCRQAGVPVFWKQLGAVQARNLGLKDPKGGNPDEWPFEGRREFPESIPVIEPEPEPVQASLF